MADADENDGVKYLESGQIVRLVCPVDGGFLVKPIIQSGADGDEYAGKTIFVERVFSEAPTEKISEKLTALQKAVNDLYDTKQQLEQQVADIQQSEKARLAKYRQYQQLELLDQFLDGKITHYAVMSNYGTPFIVDFKDTKDEYGRKQFRLLSLFGGTNGDLEWRLHQYSDYSGSSEMCVPCTSRDHATEVIKKFIEGRLNETAQSPRGDVIVIANKFGVVVAPSYLAKHCEARQSAIESEIQGYEKRIGECRSELASLHASSGEPVSA